MLRRPRSCVHGLLGFTRAAPHAASPDSRSIARSEDRSESESECGCALTHRQIRVCRPSVTDSLTSMPMPPCRSSSTVPRDRSSDEVEQQSSLPSAQTERAFSNSWHRYAILQSAHAHAHHCHRATAPRAPMPDRRYSTPTVPASGTPRRRLRVLSTQQSTWCTHPRPPAAASSNILLSSRSPLPASIIS